jgi:hypothetical protein
MSSMKNPLASPGLAVRHPGAMWARYLASNDPSAPQFPPGIDLEAFDLLDKGIPRLAAFGNFTLPGRLPNNLAMRVEGIGLYIDVPEEAEQTFSPSIGLTLRAGDSRVIQVQAADITAAGRSALFDHSLHPIPFPLPYQPSRLFTAKVEDLGLDAPAFAVLPRMPLAVVLRLPQAAIDFVQRIKQTPHIDQPLYLDVRIYLIGTVTMPF